MELDLTDPFYLRMATDAQLIADLSEYPNANESSGFQPAIFTDEEVPEDAVLPYIWSNGEVSVAPDDDKLNVGVALIRDINIYAPKNDTERLNRIAWRVRHLFHRHELVVAGAETIIAESMGPRKAPTDDTVDGKIVSVRLRMHDAS